MKITVLTNRSSNSESSEYLFDVTGRLIFYFEKNNYDGEAESRFYFSYCKVIRVLRDQKTSALNNRQQLAAAKAVQAQARKLVGIFQRSLEN